MQMVVVARGLSQLGQEVFELLLAVAVQKPVEELLVILATVPIRVSFVKKTMISRNLRGIHELLTNLLLFVHVPQRSELADQMHVDLVAADCSIVET